MCEVKILGIPKRYGRDFFLILNSSFFPEGYTFKYTEDKKVSDRYLPIHSVIYIY
jgi:hypothetical protein